MPWIATWPISALVPARSMPWSTKNVPRVTMKLGSRVRMTSHPLRKPTTRASASDTRIATQMLRPYSVVRMPTTSPVKPVMAPADRSNSPPIISIATATAMIPIVDADRSHVAAPGRVANTSVVTVKNAKITTAASSAPISGRFVRRARADVRATCSSATAMLLIGAFLSFRPGGRSAGAVLGELQHLVGVLGRDERRAGVDRLAATDVVAVDGLEVQGGHSEEALHVGLLVDGEVDRALLDVGDDVLAEVEGGDLRVAAGLLDRR